MVEKIFMGKCNDSLIRIGLQFFADANGDGIEDEEEGGSGVGISTQPTYVSDGLGQKTDKNAWLGENGYARSEEEYNQKVGAITDEQDFYQKYDLDPDRDYNNTKKTLEYDYMTSMANYGANAEKLYQMGLSNSGVSDIFQANAYSAYLANVNTAAADRIKAKKDNKNKWLEYDAGIKAGWIQEQQKGNAAYGAYESGYDTTLKSDTNSAYQAVLNSGMFTGHKSENGSAWVDYDRISNYLKNMGYSSVVIDAVWKRIEGMDLGTLQNTRIRTGYSAYYEMYSGPDSVNSIREKLKTDPANYNDDEINKIMKWIEDDWKLTPDGQTAAHRTTQVVVDATGNVVTATTNADGNVTYTDADGNVVEGNFIETTQGEADDAYNAARTYLSQGSDPDTIKALLEADFGAGAVAYAMNKIQRIYDATSEPTIMVDAEGNVVTEGGYTINESEQRQLGSIIRGLDFTKTSLADFIAEVNDSDYSEGAKKWLTDAANAAWEKFPQEFATQIWPSIMYDYTGSEVDKNGIKEAYLGYNFDDAQWDEIFDSFDGKIQKQEQAADQDMVNDVGGAAEDGTLTADDVVNSLENTTTEEGKQQIVKTAEEEFTGILGSKDIEEGWTFMGYTEEAWKSMEPAEREMHVMNKAAEMCSDGAISKSYFGNIAGEWAKSELDLLDEEDLESINIVIDQFAKWNEAAKVTNDDFKKAIKRVAESSVFTPTCIKTTCDQHFKKQALFDNSIPTELKEFSTTMKPGETMHVTVDKALYEIKVLSNGQIGYNRILVESGSEMTCIYALFVEACRNNGIGGGGGSVKLTLPGANTSSDLTQTMN